jgi:hypothetical protein
MGKEFWAGYRSGTASRKAIQNCYEFYMGRLFFHEINIVQTKKKSALQGLTFLGAFVSDQKREPTPNSYP